MNYFLYCWVSCRYAIHDIRKLDRNDHTAFRENSLASVFVSLCSETDVDFQYVFAHTGLSPNLSRFSIIVLSYESFALYREQKASHSFLRIGIKARLLMDVLQCTRMAEPEIQSSSRLASVTEENWIPFDSSFSYAKYYLTPVFLYIVSRIDISHLHVLYMYLNSLANKQFI